MLLPLGDPAAKLLINHHVESPEVPPVVLRPRAWFHFPRAGDAGAPSVPHDGGAEDYGAQKHQRDRPGDVLKSHL